MPCQVVISNNFKRGPDGERLYPVRENDGKTITSRSKIVGHVTPDYETESYRMCDDLIKWMTFDLGIDGIDGELAALRFSTFSGLGCFVRGFVDGMHRAFNARG